MLRCWRLTLFQSIHYDRRFIPTLQPNVERAGGLQQICRQFWTFKSEVKHMEYLHLVVLSHANSHASPCDVIGCGFDGFKMANAKTYPRAKNLQFANASHEVRTHFDTSVTPRGRNVCGAVTGKHLRMHHLKRCSTHFRITNEGFDPSPLKCRGIASDWSLVEARILDSLQTPPSTASGPGKTKYYRMLYKIDERVHSCECCGLSRLPSTKAKVRWCVCFIAW